MQGVQQVQAVPLPFTGINKNLTGVQLTIDQAISVHNFTVEDGMLKKRLGYKTLGDEFDGYGLELISFTNGYGVDYVVACTSTGIYKYVATDDSWSNISPTYTLDGVADTVYTFGGKETNRWSHAEVYSQESEIMSSLVVTGGTHVFTPITSTPGQLRGYTGLLLTNGFNKPIIWDGDKARFKFVNMADFTGLDFIREVAQDRNHTILARPTTTEDYVKNLRWSDVGSIINYTTGTSGEKFIADAVGKLSRIKKLNDEMIVYFTSSVCKLKYTGVGTIFTAQTNLSDNGLLTEKALWDFPQVHFYASTDRKFYVYAGGNNIISFGDAFDTWFFDTIDYEKLEHFVFAFDQNKNDLYLFYVSTQTFDERAFDYIKLRLNQQRTSVIGIVEGRFGHCLRDLTTCASSRSYACDSALFRTPDVLCDDSYYGPMTCSEMLISAAYPVPTFITSYKNVSDEPKARVFILDNVYGTDAGEAISCHIETKDYTLEQGNQVTEVRWLGLALDCACLTASEETSLLVEFSTDLGETWTTAEILSGIF